MNFARKKIFKNLQNLFPQKNRLIPFDDNQNTNYEVINFCTTHKEPYLPLSDSTIRLEIGDKGTLDRDRHHHVLNCFEEVPAAKQFRHELVIISGLMTASRYLKRNNVGSDTMVNFTTYRLFMLPERLKHHSPWPQMNHVTHEEVSQYQNDICPEKTNRPWLLPAFFISLPLEKRHDKIYGYNAFDLFIEGAIKEGILDDYHSVRMRKNAIHLTAMGIGRLPADIFIDISEKAEIAIFRFLRDHLQIIPEEHRFKCALYYYERIAIYFMEEHIRDRYGMLPNSLFGFWTLVDDSRQYKTGELEVA